MIERRALAAGDRYLETSDREQITLAARIEAIDEIRALAAAIRKRGRKAEAVGFLKRAAAFAGWVIFAGVISRMVL